MYNLSIISYYKNISELKVKLRRYLLILSVAPPHSPELYRCLSFFNINNKFFLINNYLILLTLNVRA